MADVDLGDVWSILLGHCATDALGNYTVPGLALVPASEVAIDHMRCPSRLVVVDWHPNFGPPVLVRACV